MTTTNNNLIWTLATDNNLAWARIILLRNDEFPGTSVSQEVPALISIVLSVEIQRNESYPKDSIHCAFIVPNEKVPTVLNDQLVDRWGNTDTDHRIRQKFYSGDNLSELVTKAVKEGVQAIQTLNKVAYRRLWIAQEREKMEKTQLDSIEKCRALAVSLTNDLTSKENNLTFKQKVDLASKSNS